MRGALTALACVAMSAPAGMGAAADLSLGNRVFFDDNDNGRLDEGERGVAGWSVTLRGADGAQVATQTTSASGHYRFDGLAEGIYSVEVAVPSGYRSSADVATSADPSTGQDSDDNGIGAITGAVSSGPVRLGTTPAPTAEADVAPEGQGSADDRADMSVDFGIVRVAVIPVFFVVPPVVTPPAPTADLSLSALAPARATPGQIVDYRLRVENTSKIPARDVVIDVAAPLGVSVVQTVRVENARRTRQRLVLGTLPARSSRLLRLRLRFIKVRPGMRMTVDARVDSRNARSDTAAASVRVVAPSSGGVF